MKEKTGRMGNSLNHMKQASSPVVLTIAGLDPSGGAGVIADIRAFMALGCFPTAAITSLTFQNTADVFGFSHQSAETVRAQVLPIIEDLHVSAAKTGMLPTREVVAEVARLFRETHLPAPVVDPVIRSTSGAVLTDESAQRALILDLFPLARVVTPNIPEAEQLAGLKILDQQAMHKAAEEIRKMGPRAVLIKGGHLPIHAERSGEHEATAGQQTEPAEAIDLLNDEGKVTVFRGRWIAGPQIHGSGCTLSAAIAACLGRGMELEDSIREAKQFVHNLIGLSQSLGHGARVLMNRI